MPMDLVDSTAPMDSTAMGLRSVLLDSMGLRLVFLALLVAALYTRMMSTNTSMTKNITSMTSKKWTTSKKWPQRSKKWRKTRRRNEWRNERNKKRSQKKKQSRKENKQKENKQSPHGGEEQEEEPSRICQVHCPS